MGIEITPRGEALAVEIASLAREDVGHAIETALAERLERLKTRWQMRDIRDVELLAWFEELDARPRSQDMRSVKQFEDEELYGEYGQPIG